MSNNKEKYELYYAGKIEDLDEFEVFYNSTYRMSPEKKFIETFRLTETMLELQGRSKDELRLDRTTLVLKRI
jgi:hypothetical protein